MKIKFLKSDNYPRWKATVYDFSDEPNSGEVLHYLHGANNVNKKDQFCYAFHTGDDYEATNYEVTTARNMQLLELLGEKRPRFIIVVSLGNTWLLNAVKDPNQSPKETDLEEFRKIIYIIETQMGLGPNLNGRLLMGHSCGGWNASVLCSQPETRAMFSKTLIINPLWMNQSWKSALPAEWAFTNSTMAGVLVESAMKEKAFQDAYWGSYGWKLMKDIPGKVLVMSSMDDIFKFFVSAGEVKDIADAFSYTAIQFYTGYGNHNHFSPKIAAEFFR